jgi:hypothetical protein
MGLLKGFLEGLLKMRAAAGTAGAAAFACVLLLSCQRQFDNPYLPGSGEYAGAEWSRDGDGDGVADSVAKYAPGCTSGPDACLRSALANAGTGGEVPVDTPVTAKPGLDSVVAEDLALSVGGDAVTPRFRCYPPGLAGIGYTLQSDDPRVAATDGRVIKPVGQGNTEVTLTAERPGEAPKTAVFKVAVTRNRVLVASLKAADLEMKAGEERAPTVTLLPADADDARFELESRNPAVAEVRNGSVIAKAKGTARIVVRALDGGGAQTEFKVKVTVKLLDIDADGLVLDAGDPPAAPHLSFDPPEAATDDYRLEGGDSRIATVTPDGKKVAPLGPGLAFFTVRAPDGIFAVFTVQVKAKVIPVIAVEVQDMVFDYQGFSARKAPVIFWQPADATDKGYTLTSDNLLVAIIVGGAVESVLPGETTVTLATHDGDKRAVFRVQVNLIGSGGGGGGPDDGADKGKGGKGPGKGKGGEDLAPAPAPAPSPV